MLYINADIVQKSPVMNLSFSAEVVRGLLRRKKEGTAFFAQEVPMFPKRANGGFYSLPSCLEEEGIAGIKWTTHIKPGQPYTKPVILLNDFSDGRPIALIDGLEISGIRTGAVSFQFFRRLRTWDKKGILVCGAGHQAKWQIMAALAAVPEIERIYIWSRNVEHAEACKEKVTDLIFRRFSQQTEDELQRKDLEEILRPVRDFTSVLDQVDLVVGATSAEEPYLSADHLQSVSYAHIGMNDVSPEAIYSYERILCDDFASGTGKSAQSLFRLYRKDPSIEKRVSLLEDLSEEPLEGRVMFDSFGLSIFDIGLGLQAYRFAREHGLGQKLDLYENEKNI